MEFHSIIEIKKLPSEMTKLYSGQSILGCTWIKILTLVPLFLQLETLEISDVDIFKSVPDQWH